MPNLIGKATTIYSNHIKKGNIMKKIIMGIVMMLAVQSSLNAGTLPTQENVAKLYVATFNRAPDTGGLNYWANDAGLDLEGIAQSFFDQPETKAAYPADSSNTDFVEAVYRNLFNRAAEQAGLAYWVSELNSGRIAKSTFILAVINGALGDDVIILNHKMEVGLYFVKKGLNNPDDALLVMADVTEDPDTVVTAKNLIDNILNGTVSEFEVRYKEAEGVIENSLSQMSQNTNMTKEQFLTKVDEVVAALQNDVAVDSVEVSDDKLEISITSKSGIETGILFTIKLKESEADVALKSSRSLTADSQPAFLPATVNKNVLILEPYATVDNWTLSNGDALEYSNIGFNVTRKTNNRVTPENFKNWDNYGYIIVRTHGEKSGGLLTGNETTSEQNKKYLGDLDAKRLKKTLHVVVESIDNLLSIIDVTSNLIGLGSWVYSIQPTFIKYYAQNKLPDSLVYIESCSSMWKTNPLLNILKDEMGAKTVIGYTDTVFIQYSMLISIILHNSLLEGKTVLESLNDATGIHGNNDAIWANNNFPDVDDGTPAAPVFKGDGNFKLVKESNGAVNIDDHGNTIAAATSLTTNLDGEIELAGDVDYFKVIVDATGVLTLYSTGDLDAFAQLYNSTGTILTSNDDDSNTNFKIIYDVTPGEYYLKVSAEDETVTGSYTVYSELTIEGIVNNISTLDNTRIKWEEDVSSTHIEGNTYKHVYTLELYEDKTCLLVDVNSELSNENNDRQEVYDIWLAEYMETHFLPPSNKINPAGLVYDDSISHSCDWLSTTSFLKLSFPPDIEIPLVDGLLRIGDVMDNDCDTLNGCKVLSIDSI